MGNIRYLVNEKNINKLNFELIYISKSKYEKDWHSTPHNHPFAEILFITSGQGSIQLENTTQKVSEGDLIIINPNCIHTEKCSNINTPLEYIAFGIDNLTLNSDVSDTPSNENVSLKLYEVLDFRYSKSEILSLLDAIIREVNLKDTSYELVCKSLLTLFLIKILRHSKSNLFKTESCENINAECLKIKSYIDYNYSENITLDLLSSLTHMNKFHVSHLFTKEMGISPINYLINKRIEESKVLLATTNYSIVDIASIVGFSNSSYFSQMFKKITNLSPRKFRTTSEVKIAE